MNYVIIVRLAERKDKRDIEKKLSSVKSLGAAGDSDDEQDAKSWVKKSRQKELERKQAEQRVCVC